MNIVAVGAIWLHLLATVSLVGFYGVLATLVLPTLRRTGSPESIAETVVALGRRAMPVLIAALVVFLATGVYLLGADSRYGGPGNIGGPWATLLLVKHILIVAMLVLGSYLDGLMARLTTRPDKAPDAALAQVGRVSGAMAILGAGILLLTAVAQAS